MIADNASEEDSNKSKCSNDGIFRQFKWFFDFNGKDLQLKIFQNVKQRIN